MIHQGNYRLPAEWETQSGIQLTWPHDQTDWAPMLDDITATYEEMAREILKREPLLIVGPAEISLSSTLHSAAFPSAKASGTLCSTVFPEADASGTPYSNDTWARDHGFITLVNDQGGVRLLDFKFNGWGEKFPAELDNAINRRLYDSGRVCGDYSNQLDFVLEGGSIESDGKGTVFTTTGCLMAPHRNQPLTQQQIEERLKSVLCAERIVWINHGQLTGDDTDGHIDTLVRICPDDTLLYVACDDPNDEQYQELHLMELELQSLRTLDGRPYRLMKLPMPRPIFETASGSAIERLPATYANFLIINGAVLVPTYAQPDLDSLALRIVGQAFPQREIIPIDCCSVIRQHGSLHCCTMQFPEGVIKSH